MARTYKYSVLSAIPDPRRGERVNVGILVFRPDGIDLRLPQVSSKLRALTGQNLQRRIEGVQALYERMFVRSQTPSEMLKRFQSVEPMLAPSDLGSFVASTTDYDKVIEEILATLVVVPRRERGETEPKFKTQIANNFREAGLLAPKDEGIESGKVVKNFQIGSEEGVVADFAMKNGMFHVASTLDMRKEQHGLLEASYKSIVLDRAQANYPDQVETVGVLILDPGAHSSFRTQIALFEKYADRMFDLTDPKAEKRLRRHFQDAMDHSDPLL